jgi:hypothetical protein
MSASKLQSLIATVAAADKAVEIARSELMQAQVLHDQLDVELQHAVAANAVASIEDAPRTARAEFDCRARRDAARRQAQAAEQRRVSAEHKARAAKATVSEAAKAHVTAEALPLFDAFVVHQAATEQLREQLLAHFDPTSPGALTWAQWVQVRTGSPSAVVAQRAISDLIVPVNVLRTPLAHGDTNERQATGRIAAHREALERRVADLANGTASG